MKIGVLGFRGRLGTELIRRGCFPIDIDITDLEQIRKAELNNYDVIINCASYTHVDKAETEIVKCYLINAFSPENICYSFNNKLVHISTDYIFDGQRGLYTENDIPSPVNSYGFSKFWGEVPVRRNEKNLIIRTTVLYDAGEKPNFVSSVYKSLKENKLIHVPELFGNPTWIPHLVDGILYSIDKNISGIVNIVGRDWVSRRELAVKIADLFGFDKNLVQIGESVGDAKRGNYYGLNVEKADSLGIPIYSLKDGLDEFKKSMEK